MWCRTKFGLSWCESAAVDGPCIYVPQIIVCAINCSCRSKDSTEPLSVVAHALRTSRCEFTGAPIWPWPGPAAARAIPLPQKQDRKESQLTDYLWAVGMQAEQRATHIPARAP